MTFTDTIQKLTKINQPKQIEFLEFVVKVLSSCSAVSCLLVRGSISTGRLDRSSDVDLVIGVHSSFIKTYLNVLNSLVTIEFGSLFPGWHDSLAPNLGGYGFVFLIPFKGELLELDVYVVEEKTIPVITNSGALQIYSNIQDTQSLLILQNKEKQLKNLDDFLGKGVKLNTVTEIFCLLHMMKKRLIRKQSFIVYGLSYLINDALRNLIKLSLAPNSKHWGWYHLEDEVGVDPRGRKCLNALSELINPSVLYNSAYIDFVFKNVEIIFQNTIPDILSDISLQIDAYKYYMQIK